MHADVRVVPETLGDRRSEPADGLEDVDAATPPRVEIAGPLALVPAEIEHQRVGCQVVVEAQPQVAAVGIELRHVAPVLALMAAAP